MMSAIKNLIYWVVLISVIYLAGHQIYTVYEQNLPCAQPIRFALGVTDARFNISDETLFENITDAAEIWNTAAQKTVLVYDPRAELKINLVYDEREATALLGSEIARQQAEIDAERVVLDALQIRLSAEQETYNEKVTAVNARGGAKPNEVPALERMRASLNMLAKQVTDKTVAVNASIAILNATIERYNQTAGHTFEQGQFVRDDEGERINIFEFVGTDQLKRVLAHEFGHAIGLDHNDDPSSIMYAKNESGNLVPTAADLTALTALCGT